MKATTMERHKKIREAFLLLVGTMPLMKIYVVLGEQFGFSDDTIRKILHKKPP